MGGMTNDPHDVAIVGGGPAGLSAALVLGRARRRVLLIDSRRPSGFASGEMGGLLGVEQLTPHELRTRARRQLALRRTVELRDDVVLGASPGPGGFGLALASGESVRARRVLLAHGLRYRPPQLSGVEPLWGHSVLHCTFCDGWEVRDRPLAALGSGPAGARLALLVRSWSADVLLCSDGPARLTGRERAALAAAGVAVREDPIRRLSGRHDRLERIHFASGPPERRSALFVPPVLERQGLADALGCAPDNAGMIATDADGRTSVAGVYAAGDVTTAVRSAAIAIGSGSRAAKAIVLDAIEDELAAPALAA
jgi:thioredoxin reductase